MKVLSLGNICFSGDGNRISIFISASVCAMNENEAVQRESREVLFSRLVTKVISDEVIPEQRSESNERVNHAGTCTEHLNQKEQPVPRP